MDHSVDMHILRYSGEPDWFDQCMVSLDDEPCITHVIEGGFDGHIGAARAHAFTLGDAEYVSWTDDDDWVIPGAMNACLSYLDEHPDCVGVYTDYYIIDEGGEIIEECRKKPWNPRAQLCRLTEVLHLHVMRRAAVMLYLDELKNWPTYEEYVLLGLLAAHGYWHHIPIIGYAKRKRPRTVSSMRLATKGLWPAAVRRVVPTLMEAKKRYGG